MKDIENYASEDVVIYLVGTKADLQEERQVTFEEALQFANNNFISMVFETSSKTGHNVVDTFTCALK